MQRWKNLLPSSLVPQDLRKKDDCFSAHLLPNGENPGNSEEISSSSAPPLQALEPGTQVSHGRTLLAAVKSEALGHCP